jgi:hypothetical protein
MLFENETWQTIIKDILFLDVLVDIFCSDLYKALHLLLRRDTAVSFLKFYSHEIYT